MAEAPVLGGGRATVALDAAAFGARFNGPLLHESVRAELAARRRGTAATRTRRAVSGGNSKPWRQKGTGRARAGSIRAPNFTGGGIVFGPHPRHYTFKVNRKERRAALRSALSLHAERGSVAIVDVAAFSEPSTKAAAALLAGWEQPGATLVVVGAGEREAGLSFRNIDRVSVLTPESVGVADIVGAASLVCSASALEALTARALGSTVEAKVEEASGTAVTAPPEPDPEAEAEAVVAVPEIEPAGAAPAEVDSAAGEAEADADDADAVVEAEPQADAAEADAAAEVPQVAPEVETPPTSHTVADSGGQED
jgi:large subunit ribosomal protein L4